MSFFVKPYVGSAFTILNGHKGWIKHLPNLTSFGYWAHLSNTALIIYLTTIIIKRIGSKLGIMHGLCTVHKYNSSTNNIPPFRPILSAIGTATYNLAKLLVPILKEVHFLFARKSKIRIPHCLWLCLTFSHSLLIILWTKQ